MSFLRKGLFRFGKQPKGSLPTILAILGGGGVIVTTVLAVKATPPALEKIHEDSKQAHDGDPEAYTPAEAVKSAWKFYIPAGTAGIATIASIMTGTVISNRRQASLLGAYTVLKRSYAEYKKYTKEILGENMEKNISKAVEYTTAETPKDTNKAEELLFYEEISGRYFNATMVEVLDALYHFNRNFVLRGYSKLNKLYEFLSLEQTLTGEEIGWSMGAGFERYGYQWIDFDLTLTKTDDGLECYDISFPFGPTNDYLDV